LTEHRRYRADENDGTKVRPECIGPLLKDMLVSHHSLVYLVRHTCINACRRIKNIAKSEHNPYTLRQNLLKSIVGKYVEEESPGADLYMNLFGVRPQR